MSSQASKSQLSELLERAKTFSDFAARLAIKGFTLNPHSRGSPIAPHDYSLHAHNDAAIAGFLNALECTDGKSAA
jgi:hypothetical protein